VLDRSLALSQIFQTPGGTPLHTAIETVHSLHGTQWIYEAAPLSELVTTLGYLLTFEAPAADCGVSSTVHSTDCGVHSSAVSTYLEVPRYRTAVAGRVYSEASSSSEDLRALMESVESELGAYSLPACRTAAALGVEMLLQPVQVADMEMEQCQVMGRHWAGDAVPSGGELWVRFPSALTSL
jgi:hypothetical protein